MLKLHKYHSLLKYALLILTVILIGSVAMLIYKTNQATKDKGSETDLVGNMQSGNGQEEYDGPLQAQLNELDALKNKDAIMTETQDSEVPAINEQLKSLDDLRDPTADSLTNESEAQQLQELDSLRN